MFNSCYKIMNEEGNNKSLNYVLDWDGASTMLKVELTFDSEDRDSTVLVYGDPEWGGQEDIFKVLENIEVFPVMDSLRINEEERKITIFHLTKGEKRMLYTINGVEKEYNSERYVYDQIFRPIVEEGSLYMTGVNYMMTPDNFESTRPSVRFKNVLPEKFHYFLSYAPNSVPTDVFTFDNDKEKVDRSLILISKNLNIIEEEVKGIPYYYVSDSRDTINDFKKDFIPRFSKYFEYTHEFWNDFDHDYIFAVTLPLKHSSGAGGILLDYGFFMRYSDKFDDRDVITLLHETSHIWIGGKLDIGKGDWDGQWFGEGFNDYLMLCNGFVSGVFDKEKFIDYFNNEVVFKHYTSEVRNVSNEEYKVNFWSDYRYQKIPYRRGFIFAFYLDQLIRVQSKETKNLKNLLLNLMNEMEMKKKRLKDNGVQLTVEEFIEIASKYIDENQLKKDIDQLIIKGNPLDFSKITLSDDFVYNPMFNTVCNQSFEVFLEELKDNPDKKFVKNVHNALIKLKGDFEKDSKDSFMKNTIAEFEFISDGKGLDLENYFNQIKGSKVCFSAVRFFGSLQIIFSNNKFPDERIEMYFDKDYKYKKMRVGKIPTFNFKNENSKFHW